MANFKSLFLDMVPEFGWLIVVVLGLLMFLGIGAALIFKFRHRIFSNAKALMFTVNYEGSVIGVKKLFGKIDKDNSLKEIYFREIEETLSIENVLPITLGKQKYYIISQLMDGSFKVVNPKIDQSLMVLDNKLLDYKRWFATVVPQIYEATHKEELQKTAQKVMFMVIAGVIGTIAIIGIGMWATTKITMFTGSNAYSSFNALSNALNAFANNVTVIQ